LNDLIPLRGFLEIGGESNWPTAGCGWIRQGAEVLVDLSELTLGSRVLIHQQLLELAEFSRQIPASSGVS